MKRLLIIGAGGFGRETLGWAQDVDSQKRDWEVGGFLDSNPMALKSFTCPFSIVGDPLTFIPSENDRLICAIGNPVTRLKLCRDLKARGGQFITLIHPTVVIGPGCHLGDGCLLCPGIVISTNVTLGNFVAMNPHVLLGHDAVIGDGCFLAGHSEVDGNAVLGEGVFLGTHASVLPSATVEDYAMVGAGSVVVHKVRAHTTVMGAPAKQVYGYGVVS